MYVNSDYINYKYVVSCSDNYIVLTNRSSVFADFTNPQTLDVVYQYFKPSFLTIEGEQTFTSSKSFEQIDVSSNDFERGDYCDILTSSMLFIIVIVFTVLNAITRLVKKGGLIYGQ